MKKFWVALFAVALVAGFALNASAADVKFSGSYYVAGMYANNWDVNDSNNSAGVYAQRLRVATAFKIAEGLTLNTRFDALEGRWGQYGYNGAATFRNTAYKGTNDEAADDNDISFDRAWVSFAVPFGKFDVGRQASNEWGTVFATDSYDADAIHYTGNFGPVEVGLFLEKLVESYGATDYNNVKSTGGINDGDRDNYGVYAKYKWNNGVAGLALQYLKDNTEQFAGLLDTSAAGQYKMSLWTISPYVQATFGNFFVEAEINYAYGEAEADDSNFDDADIRAWNAYVHAKGTFGLPTGGLAFSPTLILWNPVSNKWLGDSSGRATSLGDPKYGTDQTGSVMENAYLGQIYGGFKPIPKLDLQAKLSFATADHTAHEYAGHEYGWELDLTASYKIYDNLTYQVGAGYLWAGDYFKGADDKNDVDDVYLIMHGLNLTF
ncbi:MAG: hypothetical protein A4E72_01676 [Syntrophus sp. PtaU1.Bin208]|nr:MAG: hypothetical protein A4E72_01676 [Syntrophus sp. PtaU1.Bin208]